MKNMKKIIFLCLSVSMMLTSCFKDIDNWYTETAGYDGRYSVALTCAEDPHLDLAIEDGEQLMIYNSAANIPNEIIIDTYLDDEHVKGKFTISGTPADFKGENVAMNVALGTAITTGNLYYAFSATGALASPPAASTATSAGLTRDGIQFYTRLSLESGKITPNGKTTIGGNISDGVLLKVTLYSDFLIYETYQTPQTNWANPNIPEFAWRVKENSRQNVDGDELHWTIDGYRYTGYPEDMVH